jgi:nitroimidazol reductase NimA-like FMN-containing flavoprotein (pyridoxamine 5'-phosphate oxidase superfamily)
MGGGLAAHPRLTYTEAELTTEARGLAERKRDAVRRFESDVDCWVATAGEGGPFLTPLSYLWDGDGFWLGTPTASPTGRNLVASGRVRLGFGRTRDVVLVDGAVTATADTAIEEAVGDAFATRTGFDPREEPTAYTYFRVRPVRVLAWREANELRGRELMRDGVWVEG